MVCRSFEWMAAALTLALFVSGCGGGADGGATVTGSVMKGGAGMPDVLVIFGPTGDGIPKGARTEANGTFSLTLLPGKYTVLLSKKVNQQGNVPGPEEDADELEASGLLRESLPQ